jgi:hypothetical protein
MNTQNGEGPEGVGYRERPASLIGAALRTSPTAGGLLLGPTFDLSTEPELHPAVAEVDCGPGHVVVALLVLADGIAVGEAEDVCDPLCVEQILRIHLGAHAS